MNGAPSGTSEWREAYGDVLPYMETAQDGSKRISYSWRREKFVTIGLPFALRLSWDKIKVVTSIEVHKYAAGAFTEAFQLIAQRRLSVYVYEFGGVYADRTVRGGVTLSAHAYGAAIDLNPETNQLGTSGDMRPEIVECFDDAGFTWGGRWQRKDPMHFQYGREYEVHAR